jgi:hypothetical protein
MEGSGYVQIISDPYLDPDSLEAQKLADPTDRKHCLGHVAHAHQVLLGNEGQEAHEELVQGVVLVGHHEDGPGHPLPEDGPGNPLALQQELLDQSDAHVCFPAARRSLHLGKGVNHGPQPYINLSRQRSHPSFLSSSKHSGR